MIGKYDNAPIFQEMISTLFQYAVQTIFGAKICQFLFNHKYNIILHYEQSYIFDYKYKRMQGDKNQLTHKFVNLEYKEVAKALTSRSPEQLQKLKQKSESLDGDAIQKNYFGDILQECIKLRMFYDVTKAFVRYKEQQEKYSSREDDVEKQLEKLLGQLQEKKKKLSKLDRQMFDKLISQTQKPQSYVQNLARILQNQEANLDQDLSKLWQDSGILTSALQVISREFIALRKSIQIHKQERKQRQTQYSQMSASHKKIVEQLEMKISLIAELKQQKYQLQVKHESQRKECLQKFQTLAKLCPTENGIREIEQQDESTDHYFRVLHDFLNKIIPNIKLYDSVIEETKQLLKLIGAPLREDPNSQQNNIQFIMVDQDDVRNEMNRLIEVLQEYFKEKEDKIKELQSFSREKEIIFECEIKLEQINKKLNIKQEQLSQIQKNNKQKDQKIQQLFEQNNQRLIQYQRLLDKHNVLSKDKQLLDLINTKHNEEMGKKVNKILQIQSELWTLKQQANKRKQQNQDLNDQINTLTTLNQQLTQEREIKEKVINELTIKYQALQQQFSKKNQQLQELIQSNKRQKSKGPIIRSKTVEMVHTNSQLFSNLSSILKDKNLLSSLDQELHQKRKFVSAELLYRYDSKNRTNIHQYIDNKPNILLIAKTAKRVVGVFCSHPFKIKQKGIGADSFLFTYKDNNMNTFPLIEGKGAFQHDKNFLVFGKSDLRIEIGSLNLSSNFGIESSHYQGKGAKVNDLLEQGTKRDVTMVNYQVFRLHGEEQINWEKNAREVQREQNKFDQDSTTIMMQALETQKEMSKLNELLNESSRENQQLKQQMRNLKQQQLKIVSQLQHQNRLSTQRFNQTIEKLKLTQSQQAALIKEGESTVDRLNREKSRLQRKIQEEQEKVIKLDSLLKTTKQEMQNLLNDDRLLILKKKIARLQQQLQKQAQNEAIISEKNRQLDEAKDYMKQLQSKIEQQTLLTDKLNKQLSELSAEIDKLRSLNEILIIEKEDLIRKNVKLSTQLEEITQKSNNQSNRLLVLEQRFKQTRNYDLFFPNQALDKQPRDKQFMIKNVEELQGRSVRWTRLLYRFDPLNKVNFHKYIDNIPYIFLLIRLQNGRVVGCYSNMAFAFGCKGQDALLMVAGTQAVFGLKRGAQAIAYDEYYILFGNSEIRLKSGEGVVFSNFGIANGHFQNNKLTVDALFGAGKEKELPIDCYQIYQMVFE